MKLRIQGNSIRLRLTPEEVAALDQHGTIEDCIQFGLTPGEALVYSLRSTDEISYVKADFANSRVTLRVPVSTAREWAATERVSINAEQPLGDGSTLRILIEKDFHP